MAKISIETKEGIELLNKVQSHEKRKRLVKKEPEVILYACKSWNDNKEKFKELVIEALNRKPEIITKFKGKNGLVANMNYITTAVLADPMVITKMNDAMKAKIDKTLFLKAFVINPLVLSINDLPVLKEKITRELDVRDRKTKEMKKQKYSTSIRTECLKAIRLSESVSKYHKGYDDFALAIAHQLTKSKNFQKKKYDSELLEKFATVMNAMIKKGNQKLRAVSPEAWLVNNGKPMYKAVRTSAEKNSLLEGLLGDMPTERLPEKVVRKLVINAVKVNPEVYLHLKEYGLEKYIDDNLVKLNVYKSLKNHKELSRVYDYLDEDDVKKNAKKTENAEKRALEKKKKAKQDKQKENSASEEKIN